jgi:hypothetical protein
VQKITNKAKEDGVKLSKKKPADAVLAKLLNDFLSNL